jgi:hypothetical protein
MIDGWRAFSLACFVGTLVCAGMAYGASMAVVVACYTLVGYWWGQADEQEQGT